MLNQELELSLNMAFARAREHRHEFMTVEHLLLALLSNPSAREALEAERRLRVALLFADGQHRCGLFDEGFELLAQCDQIHGARFQRFTGGWIAKQCKQQVLDRHKFMSVLTRSGESHV